MRRLLSTLIPALLVAMPLQALAADVSPDARAARRLQAQIDHLQRAYDHRIRRCSSNDENACNDARDLLAQIEDLKASAPAAR